MIKNIIEVFKRMKFIFSDKYTIQQILSKQQSEFTKANKRNIHLFKNKGCNCVSCDRKGSYFKKEGKAFKLYTSDNMLMTKDHIYPQAKGGTNHLYNLQPMCRECNSDKADDIPKKHYKKASETGKIQIINRIKNISKLDNSRELSEKQKERVSKYISFLKEKELFSLLLEKEIILLKNIPLNTMLGIRRVNDIIIGRI